MDRSTGMQKKTRHYAAFYSWFLKRKTKTIPCRLPIHGHSRKRNWKRASRVQHHRVPESEFPPGLNESVHVHLLKFPFVLREMTIGPLGNGHIFLDDFREGHNFLAKSLGRVKFCRFLMWTNIGALTPPPPLNNF